MIRGQLDATTLRKIPNSAADSRRWDKIFPFLTDRENRKRRAAASNGFRFIPAPNNVENRNDRDRNDSKSIDLLLLLLLLTTTMFLFRSPRKLLVVLFAQNRSDPRSRKLPLYLGRDNHYLHRAAYRYRVTKDIGVFSRGVPAAVEHASTTRNGD